jgi:hypothetical protein
MSMDHDQRENQDRMAVFARHRDKLLTILEGACESRPKTKSFNGEKAWHELTFWAMVYFDNEACIEKRRTRPTAGAARKRLQKLETALGEARSELNQAWHDHVRGAMFVEWCEANGNPDFTDPVIDAYDREFDKGVERLLAGLATFEQIAALAAKQFRQGAHGRPAGTGILSQDFILNLGEAYLHATGKSGGAGDGPFARFIGQFLEAMQRSLIEQQSVIKAIKMAKRSTRRTVRTGVAMERRSSRMPSNRQKARRNHGRKLMRVKT